MVAAAIATGGLRTGDDRADERTLCWDFPVMAQRWTVIAHRRDVETPQPGGISPAQASPDHTDKLFSDHSCPMTNARSATPDAGREKVQEPKTTVFSHGARPACQAPTASTVEVVAKLTPMSLLNGGFHPPSVLEANTIRDGRNHGRGRAWNRGREMLYCNITAGERNNVHDEITQGWRLGSTPRYRRCCWMVWVCGRVPKLAWRYTEAGLSWSRSGSRAHARRAAHPMRPEGPAKQGRARMAQ